MQFKVVQASGPRILVAVFAKGDEAVEGLTGLSRREHLGASQLTAVGAFEAATLGYFDRERREYRRIPVGEQVEVLSLVGDIALADGEPQVHAHVVLGRADGSTVGGHLLEGRVWPTLEVIVTELPAALRKRHDEQTGLALIDLNAVPPA
jgi:predicted DNA-binding protein with PD1-like motif